ncbi:glycosyltransferase [Acetobacter estunensis]|uniref:glycosyltransferase family 8 protein n=1 Tax=Acetobacter estunensis TaxID=104097 RepID=UPI001C2DD697|nr:glycosyltransferase [Acetobacter estunensis]MBV1837826.1 glycosyl transferase family 8 [Acetobacter estunensis]
MQSRAQACIEEIYRSEKKICICYTPDQSYLFPSFVSALQARRFTSRSLADIVILAFGIDPCAEAAFSEACARADIVFLSRSEADIGGAPAMLARLFLADLLPKNYDYFLYVDGDTQIHGPLDDLLHMPIPPGMFYGAPDPMTFVGDDTDRLSRTITSHFTSLGLSSSEATRYFNSGVIYAERKGWARIGIEAWKMFSNQSKESRFPDQDVLNLVGLPHCLSMSLAWNFPVYMNNIRVASIIQPRIIHYMSRPKPWEGTFPPWNAEVSAAYGEVASVYPEIARYWRSMKRTTWIRYHLQQQYKRVHAMITWGFGAKRRRILAYEQDLKQTKFYRRHTIEI